MHFATMLSNAKTPEGLGDFLKMFAGISVADFVRYAVAAGALWLFFYALRRKRWLHRKVVPGFAKGADIRREILLSALTCLVYGVVGLVTIYAILHGWTRSYFRVETYGWWWFAGSVLITIFLHDAYFYWTHRWMHRPSVYRVMHRAHHRSTNPTPWAAYAFHPLEAFVHALIFPIVVFLYPIHPLAFLTFMFVQLGFNVIGHAGFEIYPRWFLDSWMGKFFNTPTNHSMHHEFFTGNYGLYFNFWDRLMGTNHKDYEKRFREVTSAPAPAGAPVTNSPPESGVVCQTKCAVHRQ
jgi:lathosterol oxidase